jgi:hypothetical protein
VLQFILSLEGRVPAALAASVQTLNEVRFPPPQLAAAQLTARRGKRAPRPQPGRFSFLTDVTFCPVLFFEF